MVLRVLIVAAGLAGCDTVPVLAGGDEARAEEVLAALHQAGVAARAVDEGGGQRRVEVPRAEVPRAVEALAHSSPPAEPDGPLLGTESDARTRRERALSSRVSASLTALPGVRRARVLVTLSPPADFDHDTAPPPRAAVLLEHTAPVSLPRVRAVVCAGVEGLRPDDVLVELRPVSAPTGVRLVWVGPLAVAAASATPLRALLSAMLLVIAALSAALLRRALPGSR